MTMTRFALVVTAMFLAFWVFAPDEWPFFFVLALATAFMGGAVIRAQHPKPVTVRQPAPPRRRRGRTRFVFGLGIGLHGVWPFLVFYRRPR